MLALLFASGVSMFLVAARIISTRDLDRYGFLAWNLFLAWLPLIFALLACEEYRAGTDRKARFAGFSVAWLLFFPNAPYIFTDLIHLTMGSSRHFYVDMVLILLCALIGLVLGFVSLFLMQGVVTRLWGRAGSWLFVAAVAALSGFGIYLGRFQRFNSWDVIFKPLALGRGIGRWAADPLAHPNSYAFPVLFATFLFVTYLMLYALTHLQPAQFASATQNEPARA